MDPCTLTLVTHSYVVDVLYEGNRVSGSVSEATSAILPASPMQQKMGQEPLKLVLCLQKIVMIIES